MLHPSYTEIMEKVNKEAESKDIPQINSRYSIVIATAKRARQIIGGQEPMVSDMDDEKPLSIAVKELYGGELEILSDGEENEEQTALEKELEASAGSIEE